LQIGQKISYVNVGAHSSITLSLVCVCGCRQMGFTQCELTLLKTRAFKQHIGVLVWGERCELDV